MINGLTFTPLTGTRKLILLVLASVFAAAFVPVLTRSINVQRIALSTLGIGAMLWVFWKVLARMAPTELALFLGGGVALVLWLLWIFDHINTSEPRLHGAGFTLLLGTGLSVTAAASALLGQLALSLSAASGGILLAWVLSGKVDQPESESRIASALPYALAAALLGLAGVIFARLPWYALIPLASIPMVVRFVPKKSESRFIDALISSIPGLVIALAVAYWVWQTGSSDSGY